MRKLLTFLIALAVTAGVTASSFGGMMLTGVGPPPAAGGAYTGPGDVTSGAAAWYGLRAYSAAVRGTKAINLCDDTGANCTDISTNASTGALNAGGTHGSNNCDTSGTCKIKTVYDQSGNGRDVTQATVASMPTFTPNATGSLPGISFSGSQWLETAANFVTQADPYYYSWAAKRTSVGSYAAVLAQDSATAIGGFNNSANTLLMYDGAFGTVSGPSTTEGTFQSVESLFNGASSTFYYNGVGPTTVAAGAQGLTNTKHMGFGAGPSNALPLTGVILEAGIWLSDKTSTQATLNLNKKTYWGF